MITRNQVILKADDGHMLTQATEVDILNRMFCMEIWLGDADKAENYKEITQQEADELRKLQEEAQEAEMMAERERHESEARGDVVDVPAEDVEAEAESEQQQAEETETEQ